MPLWEDSCWRVVCLAHLLKYQAKEHGWWRTWGILRRLTSKPWYGNAFSKQRFSNFYIGNVRNPNSPGILESNNSTLHGYFCLYYTFSSLLPSNKTCARYVGLEASTPPDMTFCRAKYLLSVTEVNLVWVRSYTKCFDTTNGYNRGCGQKHLYKSRAFGSILQGWQAVWVWNGAKP